MAVNDDAPITYDLPTYELLLYAMVNTRFGLESRWFLAGGHHRRDLARLAFGELCEEFRNHRVVLLLVASVLDPGAERFRDVIIESRGVAPLIDRKRLRRLSQQDRPLIARAKAPPRPPASRRLPERRPSRTHVWLSLGAAALVAAAIAASLVG